MAILNTTSNNELLKLPNALINIMVNLLQREHLDVQILLRALVKEPSDTSDLGVCSKFEATSCVSFPSYSWKEPSDTLISKPFY